MFLSGQVLANHLQFSWESVCTVGALGNCLGLCLPPSTLNLKTLYQHQPHISILSTYWNNASISPWNPSFRAFYSSVLPCGRPEGQTGHKCTSPAHWKSATSGSQHTSISTRHHHTYLPRMSFKAVLKSGTKWVAINFYMLCCFRFFMFSSSSTLDSA